MLRCGAGAGLGPLLQGACGGTGQSQAIVAFVALVSGRQWAWGGPLTAGRTSTASAARRWLHRIATLHSWTALDTIAGASAVRRTLASCAADSGGRQRQRPARAATTLLSGLQPPHLAALLMVLLTVGSAAFTSMPSAALSPLLLPPRPARRLHLQRPRRQRLAALAAPAALQQQPHQH